jgi:hypothetical protein
MRHGHGAAHSRHAAARCIHSPAACCFNRSSETVCSARSCVAARTTGGALPASAASFHLGRKRASRMCCVARRCAQAALRVLPNATQLWVADLRDLLAKLVGASTAPLCHLPKLWCIDCPALSQVGEHAVHVEMCGYLETHRHQRSPGFRPGKLGGRGVLRSLPFALVNSRNSSVTCDTTSSV